MRFFRDLDHTGLSGGSVVTIGNFDGVHLGHRALLERCRVRAGTALDVALVTFDPLPGEWFHGAAAPPRLTGMAQKHVLLARAGVDLTWMMRFNGRLAAMPAPDFVQAILVGGLGARAVVVGGDFRFGNEREGDSALLRRLGQAWGFETEVMAAVEVGGERVSSTRIRAALSAGDLATAEALLGRPYSLCGRVVRGERLGRRLGYPTANIRPPRAACALGGVFAVQVREPGGRWRPGVASLGSRPAVGGRETLLEVHLFDFAGDLYGRRLETRFVAKLRDEADFPGLEALVAQMREDEQRARALLGET